MKESIFRQKNIDRISSPEQLDEYVKVSNPGIWTLMVAIILLLVGVGVWGIFGTIERTVPCAVMCTGGQALVFVEESDVDSGIQPTEVRLEDGTVLNVTGMDMEPAELTDSESGSRLIHILGSEADSLWVRAGSVSASLEDGTYAGQFVVESIKPISFVVN